MGYRDKTVRIDLSDLGDDCWVEIKNPKLASRDELLFADGADKDAESDRVTGGLIKAWNVWDVETDEPLPLPATPEVLARVPHAVRSRIEQEIIKAFPQ